ncbi:glycosyl hydrolase family 18 protein [Pendulispora brunnea]|uniref:Glycosyl hydrolase family 18 protein n=1 Tax=Pendulispora brunnea TaxID=2905690 RepID=A0ABZ2K956_9BACT
MKTTALFLLGIALASTACSSGSATSDDAADPESNVSALEADAVNAVPKTMAYVEVNSNNFNNIGCYTYGSPPKQYFNMASIFAANINYDSASGKPILYFNPQVDQVLNGTNYVKNLQSQGIKVLLTVLGNHQNAGWACFRDEGTAQNFAQQLSNAVNKYGLDGIDIDDEYSQCTSNNTSLIMVASKMRALMPSKIISKALFTDLSYFQASWNGHKLAEYLDYGWEMSYGSTNYGGRLSGYLSNGMTKAKLGIGASTGGSDGARAAQYVKDNGIGTFMVYNVTKSSQSYLSSTSNVLFGASTQTKANCLR